MTTLYVEILGRAPQAFDISYWVNLIDQGTAEDSVAKSIYASTEALNYRASHPGQTVSLGQAYVDALQAQLKVMQGG